MKLGAIPENLIEQAVLSLGIAPTPLSDTHLSFMMARTIMVATKIGIFEALAHTSLPVEDIIIRTQTDRQATLKLLYTLVHLGYLTKKDTLFSLTPLSRKWMLKDSPASLHDKMLLQFIEWELVEHYEDYIRSGTPVDMHRLFDEKQWEVYQRGMRSVAGTSAQEIGRRTPVPPKATRMLDIGGAHGYFSVAICRRNPSLHAVILDLPEAIKHAEKILAKEAIGDRVQHQAGNIITEELEDASYDLIFIANLAHHFDDATNRSIAKKAYRALRPGGYYIIQDFIRNQEPKKGDHLGALLDLYFAATSQSGTWSVEEISNWQKATGFVHKKTVWLRTMPGHAQVVAMKPKQT